MTLTLGQSLYKRIELRFPAMCVNCALNAFEQGASAGGSSAVPVLAATSASALGMRKLSNWLLALNVGWVTARRLKVATAIVILAGLVFVASLDTGSPTT